MLLGRRKNGDCRKFSAFYYRGLPDHTRMRTMNRLRRARVCVCQLSLLLSLPLSIYGHVVVEIFVAVYSSG